jgi:hypothetical protein
MPSPHKQRKVVKNIRTVDKTTGEVLADDFTSVGYNAEANYVKIYAEGVEKMVTMVSPHCITAFVLACTKMNYDGDALLPAQIRREMAIKMRIKTATFSGYIDQLSYAGILIKRGVNCYIVNPFFAGKGAWSEIMRKREDITYDAAKGRYFHKGIVDFY